MKKGDRKFLVLVFDRGGGISIDTPISAELIAGVDEVNKSLDYFDEDTDVEVYEVLKKVEVNTSVKRTVDE